LAFSGGVAKKKRFGFRFGVYWRFFGLAFSENYALKTQFLTKFKRFQKRHILPFQGKL